MSDYNRSTQERAFQQMHPELIQAILTLAEKKELGDIANATLLCIKTRNEKKKKGLFGTSEPPQFVGALITPIYFIWACCGGKSATFAASMKLRDLDVKKFQSTLIEDTGLDITGFIQDASERATTFLGLDSEPAAKKFSDALKKAATQA